jgi:putative peptidoglycan lipid II flippase
LIRSAVATFFSRGDTSTPVKAALLAAAVNIAFKFLLMGPLAQVGLALATSIGAWINLGLVIWFAARAGHITRDERLRQSMLKLALAGVALAAVLWLCVAPVSRWLSGWNNLHDLAALGVLAVLGAVVYGGIVLLLFGSGWLAAFRARRRG